MNKTYNRNTKSLLFTVVICLILFNCIFVASGCGLDTFIFFDAPVSDFKPNIEDESQDRQSFKFTTKENELGLLGTDVYYKIYSDKSTLNSETNLINVRQEELVDSMLNTLTQSYHYNKLFKLHEDNDFFIPWEGDSRSVEIRLTDNDPFKAQILIDGAFYDIPVRSFKYKSFNFAVPGNAPLANDSDIYSGNFNGSSKWYVAMYAVTCGHDEKWSNIYSKVTYLGSVTIR